MPRKSGPARPTEAQWVEVATRHAMMAGLPPGPLLGGDRKRKYVVVRWAAWREILATGRYSINGLARTSGYNHATILNGLKRTEQGAAP